jgi:predicted nucleotidyltransferase
MHRSLGLEEARLAAFCQVHHIQKMSLLGSQLKGGGRPDSDMDLLVEFEVGYTPSLFDLAGMELELSECLGKKADLRTAGELSRYFRDDVLNTAVVQHVA